MSELKNVTCNECGRLLSLEEALKERPVEGYTTAREIGLSCSHCEAWAHCYFMNPRLDRLQEIVQKRKDALKKTREGKLTGSAVALKRYRKARKRYRREFDRYNAWLRDQLGVRAPAEASQHQQNVS